jgi:hypothetical protein
MKAAGAAVTLRGRYSTSMDHGGDERTTNSEGGISCSHCQFLDLLDLANFDYYYLYM